MYIAGRAGRMRRFLKYINSVFIGCTGVIPKKAGEEEERAFAWREWYAKEQK